MNGGRGQSYEGAPQGLCVGGESNTPIEPPLCSHRRPQKPPSEKLSNGMQTQASIEQDMLYWKYNCCGMVMPLGPDES